MNQNYPLDLQWCRQQLLRNARGQLAEDLVGQVYDYSFYDEWEIRFAYLTMIHDDVLREWHGQVTVKEAP